jgi:hypothetical protein
MTPVDLCNLSSRAAPAVITLGNAGVSQLTKGKTMKFTSSARVIAAGAVGIMAAAVLTAAPASATAVGNSEGCTPGFWKNHTPWTSYEVEYSTGQTVSSMLGGYTFPASLSQFQGTTMLEALQGSGGPGVTGAAKILLRAGTAAYLNADVEILYPYRRDTTGFGGVASLKSLITSALNSQDRATMLALAAQLDAANNLGCPLS